MARTEHGSFLRGRRVRGAWQIVFLLLFILLAAAGRVQLWLGIFALLGAAASLFYGRIYCSAVCPMGTMMRFESRLLRRLKVKRLKTPGWMKSTRVRIASLTVILASMIVLQRAGVNLPFLPALLLLSLVISLVFEERLWHRSLCPFGSILALTSRKAPRGITIDEHLCTGCGACEQVCRTGCISREDGVRQINGSECIGCYDCVRVCPKGAVSYGRT